MIGGAYGGGVELILNCDLVVASQDAKFALAEVKRGVVAIQGGEYLDFYFFWMIKKFRFSFFSPFTDSFSRYSPTLEDSRTPGKNI